MVKIFYYLDVVKNMDMNTWTVVQFLSDDTVEAIPTKWLVGEMCHWPPYPKERLSNAIRKSEQLNTYWPTEKVKIFRNSTYDEYQLARSKAKKAEHTSDLNSDRDERKRKRIQKLYSDSSSDDEQWGDETLIHFPSPPKIYNRARISKTVKKKTDFEEILLESNNDPICMDAPSKASQNNTSDIEVAPTTSTPCNIPNNTSEASSSECNSSCKCCRERNVSENQLKELLKQNYFIRGIACDILAEIKTISKGTITTMETENKSMFHHCNFPITMLDDLNKIQEYLENQENFKFAVQEISRFGGRGYEFVKRALTPIISDELAEKFSWMGRKKKNDFSKLKIAKLVIEAAEVANASKSRRDTEMAIASWLKRAKERRERVSKKFEENNSTIL